MSKKSIIYFCLFLVCFLATNAQKPLPKVDSLTKLLERKTDTAKVNTLLALGNEYSMSDQQAAERTFAKALVMCDSLKYTAGKAKTLKELGRLKSNQSEFKQAYKYLNDALTLYMQTADQMGVADCQLNMSLINNRLANFPKAYEQASGSLNIARKLKNLPGMARAYNMLGIIHDNMNDSANAMRSYHKALEIYTSENDKGGLAKVYLNIAVLYNKKGQFAEAEDLLDKVELIGEETRDIRLLAIAYGNKGLMYDKAGNTDKALEFYHKSLALKEELMDQHGIMITEINIGSSYLNKGDNNMALKHLLIAKDLGNKLGTKKELVDAFDLLTKVYENKGDFRNAYLTLREKQALNDSIYGQNQVNEIADMKSINDINQLESENKILRQQSVIDRLKLENNRFIRYYLLIGLAFAIVLIGLMIFQSAERRKNSTRLDEANHQLTAANEQLKQSESELAESNRTKDRFFSIISHDLRNPLASMVSFVRILKRDFDSLDNNERQSLIDEFEKIVNRTGTLLENLLLWSKSQTGKLVISPIAIPALQLIEENIELNSGWIKSKSIALQVQKDLKPVTIYADLNMMNTVVRNLLSNAIKFTPPEGAIQIGYNTQDNLCVFYLTDNGLGIPEGKLPELFELGKEYIRTGTANEKGSGLGLVLCKDFVEKNGGKIWVESVVDKGTTFYFSVPVAGSDRG